MLGRGEFDITFHALGAPLHPRGTWVLVCSSRRCKTINPALEDQTVPLLGQLFNKETEKN